MTDMHCSVCQSSETTLSFDLGDIPLCDALSESKSIASSAPSFPITVQTCKICCHSELITKPPEDIIYSNYTYRSSGSPGLPSHFQSYADYLVHPHLSTETRRLIFLILVVMMAYLHLLWLNMDLGLP